ncbi:MAG TPA: hypothetical protein VMH79_00500 [Thermoanaerobaculia bacterium]|nr:hypothetical protein [Thermoanaerobaculia bacterium]
MPTHPDVSGRGCETAGDILGPKAASVGQRQDLAIIAVELFEAFSDSREALFCDECGQRVLRHVFGGGTKSPERAVGSTRGTVALLTHVNGRCEKKCRQSSDVTKPVRPQGLEAAPKGLLRDVLGICPIPGTPRREERETHAKLFEVRLA